MPLEASITTLTACHPPTISEPLCCGGGQRVATFAPDYVIEPVS
jgi:hypothetical protein